jgi:hypothetical protein
MKAVWTALAAAALLAAPARAQRGLAVEARGGAAAGNYAAAASEFTLAPRPSIAVSAAYGVTDRVGVYAGISRSSFGCDTGFCAGRTVGFTSQGVDAGGELRLPLPAAPWIRAGIVSHSLRHEGRQAGGVGFSAGGGVELRLGRRLSLTPGVRYVRYGAADDDGVALLVGDVGLKIRM